MPPYAPPLPIDSILPQVRAALDTAGTAVVVAAPGAGKTTRLPLALLDAAWRGDGRVIVLEPRRLAARAAATQMARLLGEPVGETVGYRVRLESRVSARTRIEVVTEGILTRMLQDDPALEGVAAVLFDEFHERHLPGDLGLALSLESRAVLRPDLRLVVMSATLEAEPVAGLLNGPVIVSEGRQFPVETTWRPLRDDVPFGLGVAQAIRAAMHEGEGDVLVFLPGVGEMRRVQDALDESVTRVADVLLLHGSLGLDEQNRVLQRDGARRRVILSTSIAESSVTIDGVRTVVDAGLARVPRYSPRSGMTQLVTVRVSRASADQRRGRAGRQAPGRCIRLWDAATDASLAARPVPEVLDADLTPLALELACAGVTDATSLRWLDVPPAGALAQARALLTDLGALDANGRVTPHGRAMATLGIEPRLAHAVLRGTALGVGALACDVAALLGERDVFTREAAAHDEDLGSRLHVLRGRGTLGAADRHRLARVRDEAKALRRMVNVSDVPPHTPSNALSDGSDESALGTIVALAFPDRIAKRRAGAPGRYLLRNGRGARLSGEGSSLARAEYLAIADLDGAPAESRVWLAAALDEDELRTAMGAAIATVHAVHWDTALDGVVAAEREQLGAIVLRERPLKAIADDEIADAFLAEVRTRGVGALPWGDAATSLRQRLAFAHEAMPKTFPDGSDEALTATLDEWLRPTVHGIRRWRDLTPARLRDALLGTLPWNVRGRLDAVAPTHLEVPSGSRIPIDYAERPPVLAVRLQEMFGLTETPRVADGRVALTIHLLSPAGRPVQVTRDLANFWKTTYFDVKKDLKGRYPKHYWPDDPLHAPPTRRAKPRT